MSDSKGALKFRREANTTATRCAEQMLPQQLGPADWRHIFYLAESSELDGKIWKHLVK